jgi:hypothetical protein
LAAQSWDPSAEGMGKMRCRCGGFCVELVRSWVVVGEMFGWI